MKQLLISAALLCCTSGLAQDVIFQNPKDLTAYEKVIHEVNERKYANNSYEENIIMGFSAGALATKLTLQQMEKKHLEQGALHPHTKLFISNDGENGGANVPLGMQHAVKYLYEYEYNQIATDYNTYALNYILNAPLSKELLHYFHSASGSGDFPGQGPDPMRTAYLQHHSWNWPRIAFHPAVIPFLPLVFIFNLHRTLFNC